MKPGIYEGISNEEYHRGPGLSKSGLALLSKNPRHYQARYIDGVEQKEPTKAMKIGQATHTYVLEHSLFSRQYMIDPKLPKRSNADKAAWEQWQKQHRGVTLLTEDDMCLVTGMGDAVMSNGRAKALLFDTPGAPEMSLYAEINGVLVKCRPDYLTNRSIIIDLKTAEDASPDGFMRAVYNNKLYVQAALYCDICKALGLPGDFLFIVVEKSKPYSVAIYKASDRMIELGRMEYMRGLEIYKQCLSSAIWPDYNNGDIVALDLPVWAERQIELACA